LTYLASQFKRSNGVYTSGSMSSESFEAGHWRRLANSSFLYNLSIYLNEKNLRSKHCFERWGDRQLNARHSWDKNKMFYNNFCSQDPTIIFEHDMYILWFVSNLSVALKNY
jgi:hypothetical protein